MSLASDIVTTLGAVLSGRLYPSVAPSGVASGTAPYGVYQMVSGGPLSDMVGQSNLTNARIQIDLFGRTKTELDALAESVKAAMDTATLFKSVFQNQMDLFEDPSILYRVMLDFSIWRYD